MCSTYCGVFMVFVPKVGSLSHYVFSQLLGHITWKNASTLEWVIFNVNTKDKRSNCGVLLCKIRQIKCRNQRQSERSADILNFLFQATTTLPEVSSTTNPGSGSVPLCTVPGLTGSLWWVLIKLCCLHRMFRVKNISSHSTVKQLRNKLMYITFVISIFL